MNSFVCEKLKTNNVYLREQILCRIVSKREIQKTNIKKERCYWQSHSDEFIRNKGYVS
jgi:hypothetical protein